MVTVLHAEELEIARDLGGSGYSCCGQKSRDLGYWLCVIEAQEAD